MHHSSCPTFASHSPKSEEWKMNFRTSLVPQYFTAAFLCASNWEFLFSHLNARYRVQLVQLVMTIWMPGKVKVQGETSHIHWIESTTNAHEKVWRPPPTANKNALYHFRLLSRKMSSQFNIFMVPLFAWYSNFKKTNESFLPSRDTRHEEWNNDEDARVTFCYSSWHFIFYENFDCVELWVVICMQVEQQVPPGRVLRRCLSLRGIPKLTGQELNNKTNDENKKIWFFCYFMLPHVQFQEYAALLFASFHTNNKFTVAKSKCCVLRTFRLWRRACGAMLTFSNDDTFNSLTRALELRNQFY